MTLTALDLFCGAGGSSTGLTGAGMRVVLAANHWQLAVDVHQDNHPDADHDCADISAVDPRRYPTTDILWASPECTNHSVAKGVKRATGQIDMFGDEPDPGAERSRATMWDVPRFVEAMHSRGRPYRAVIVENVVDAVRWMFWPAWLMAMHAAGYDHQVVYLNSAFAHGKDFNGAPQYRDRIYVVFWLRGAAAPDLNIRPPAWCPSCSTRVDAVQVWKKPFEAPWGRYRAQYVYRCPKGGCGEVEPAALPAAAAIDWTNLGGKIGDRKRPLAHATRERIRGGLARYAQPIGVTVGGNTFERRPGVRTWPANRPMPVRTTTASDALAVPPMLVPVEARSGLRARTAHEPLRTLTSRHENALVATDTMIPPAFLAILRGQSVTGPIDQPLSTVTAGGGHHGLTTLPDSMLMAYYGNGTCSRTSTPVPTLSTRDRFALITRTPDQVSDDEVDACTFRMLTPVEVLAAMAFPTDYLMRGTKRDRVRLAGNAVTPPAARLIGERVLAALAAS